MSEYFSRTRVGLCGLALGLCLVGVPFVTADPGGEKCMRVCENRNYFIDGDGLCWSTVPADCLCCAWTSSGAQCTYLLKSDPYNCKIRDGKETTRTFYSGGCDTPCSTVLSPGTTEASNPKGSMVFTQDVTLWECQY